LPSKDIFCSPFDEATITKLEIFEKYFETWLPVFIKKSYNRTIHVFDLFAGSGYDVKGREGSPIRILKVISKYSKLLMESNKRVSLFFNDKDQHKYEVLGEAVENEINKLGIEKCIDLTITNVEFKQCLDNCIPKFKYGCNLLFIDQNGFSQVTEPIFRKLISYDYTDFMFFISSSYIRRFATTQEFKDLHPRFDVERIKTTQLKRIHNVVCGEFQKYIPSNVIQYALYPFSLMKEDKINIYGIIFVCKHPLAANNFLRIAWDKNKLNGTANYDIDDEQANDQGHLFEKPKKTKIEYFQSILSEKILKGEISTNEEVYYYTLNEGHIPNHAAEIIIKMKNDNLISFDNRRPLVNYQQVIKLKNKIEYKVINK
jgi:three-Cys-motif partner protein